MYCGYKHNSTNRFRKFIALSRVYAFLNYRLFMMGVDIVVISPGNGSTYPKPGQTVVVHYTGTLSDGKIFDCSRERRQPFKFTLGKGDVIKGWDQGIPQMSVGERARLICSADYGYGSRGYPGMIPPNATLVFDVELLHVE